MLPFLAGFDQLAYVTTDLAQARTTFRDHGIPRFHVVERDLDAIVRGERGTLRLGLALAAVGDMEIELIEPRGGRTDLYTESLPRDGRFAIALHHLRVRVSGTLADWERARAALAAAASPIALEGGRDGVRFVYIDDRARLGHYIEHVWFSEAERARRADVIPRYEGTR
jgi:hypothetical protein